MSLYGEKKKSVKTLKLSFERLTGTDVESKDIKAATANLGLC